MNFLVMMQKLLEDVSGFIYLNICFVQLSLKILQQGADMVLWSWTQNIT